MTTFTPLLKEKHRRHRETSTSMHAMSLKTVATFQLQSTQSSLDETYQRIPYTPEVTVHNLQTLNSTKNFR
jgi:hypothetical protein